MKRALVLISLTVALLYAYACNNPPHTNMTTSDDLKYLVGVFAKYVQSEEYASMAFFMMHGTSNYVAPFGKETYGDGSTALIDRAEYQFRIKDSLLTADGRVKVAETKMIYERTGIEPNTFPDPLRANAEYHFPDHGTLSGGNLSTPRRLEIQIIPLEWIYIEANGDGNFARNRFLGIFDLNLNDTRFDSLHAYGNINKGKSWDELGSKLQGEMMMVYKQVLRVVANAWREHETEGFEKEFLK